MEKNVKKKSSLAFYGRVWAIAKPFHRHFIMMSGFIVLNGIFNALGTWYITKVVGQVVKTGLISYNVWYLIQLLVTTSSFFLIGSTISYLRDRYELKNLDFEFSKFTSTISLDKYLSFSIGQHAQEHSSISQKIVGDGQSAMQITLQLFTFELIPTIGNILVAIGVIFFVNIYIGIISVLFLIVSIFIFSKINSWFVPAILEANDLGRKNHKKASEAYRNTALITIEGKKDAIIKNFLDSYLLYVVKATKTFTKYCKQSFGVRFYYESFRSSVYIVTVIMIFKGIMLPELFLMVFIWIQNVVNGINQINMLQRRFSMGIADIEKYFEFLDRDPDVIDQEDAIELENFSGDIKFENVTFSYPERSSEISNGNGEENGTKLGVGVKNISFHIKPGMKVGLVGESGSGKTTIMNLLRRAFDPIDGKILIDNIPLRNIKQNSYRCHMGNVDQNVQLFDGSVEYNLLFGVSREVSREEIKKACKMACIDKFEEKLGCGLDTIIGEYGIKLSGGERQRVAIARALIKNPAILIFDEATSSLDTKNEKLIQDAIDRASQGRTTIIVAHRLSTVYNADKILVMNNGEIVGEGTHSELLESCSFYQDLVKEQLFQEFKNETKKVS